MAFWLGRTGFAAAQQPGTSIIGQLIDRDTRAPVSGAMVTLIGFASTATSDSAGRFTFTGVPPGLQVLQARVVGYVRAVWQLQLAEGEVLSDVFEMTGALVPLSPIDVRRGTIPHRFEQFEARRERGTGHFITREEIERRRPINLPDLLRTVRGVRAVCSGSTCTVRMARASGGCQPDYVLDGFPSSAFTVENISPLDIQGIEIYRGASETPAEFLGSTSACGVIVVWTRSGP
ncbi:MAG: carboxypeptidase regulatory-like domain-containing protein [Gemmatimonadales bacterium]|nr:carboxypeptidase regulatory-like domain-containing protein [Gemmatimonadales bacterium]